MKNGLFIIPIIVLSVLLPTCTDTDIDFDQYHQIKTSLQEMVDSTFLEYIQEVPDFPGGIVLNIIDDEENYFVSAGVDDSVTSHHHFRAASCTKTFTATAILLLHQQGKLNIEDHITDRIPGTRESYLPDAPAYDIPNKSSITIMDLLRHRAGVFDVANDDVPDTVHAEVPYRGMNYINYILEMDGSHSFSFDELVLVVAETGLSYFDPGTQYHYSNTGYTILGKIIERVANQSYRNFLTDQVLLPMNLLGSSFPESGNDQELPEPYTQGFVLYNNEIFNVTSSNVSPFVAEGNLITTPDDLTRFLGLLLSGQGVLDFYTVNTLMMDCLPTGNISGSSYGCGLSYTPNLGFGHAGAQEGYLAIMAHDPELNFTIVAYTNAWNLNGGIESLENQMINFLEYIAHRSKAIVIKKRE